MFAGSPDLSMVARSCGLNGVQVETLDDLRGAVTAPLQPSTKASRR